MAGNFGNLKDEELCVRIKKNGERCKNPRMVGLRVCLAHGGRGKNARAKSRRIKAEAIMQKFVTPIAEDHALANPIAAFEWEFRRTIGRIEFCDEMIAKLTPKDVVSGITKVERINASEYPGTNETWESAVNTWVELQFRERQHLLAMEKIWIAAKLDTKKLQIQQEFVLQLNSVITNSLRALGLDPTDPIVRNTIREQMLELEPRRDD